MYPIQMTFTVSTAAELARLSEAIAPPTDRAEVNAAIHQAPTGVAKPAAREAKDAAPSPKPEAAAAKSAPPADTPATPEPTAAASGELDYDKDVKPAFLKLVQSKGRASGRKIIDAFAPTKEKLSEAITTQEQYKQALALIQKEMA